ncbi:MAG TPA: hypothetical protein VGZ69_05170 [Candidatus Rhabdochlamydia sp.]|nr:hypothetical protein [Candidatus Rhabdochlamydia sp.]
MDLKIGSFFSSARTATANAASSVYGFGKYLVEKGCSMCSPLASKVSEFTGKFIPNVVSNTVQAYPKSFGLVAGVGLSTIVYQVFLKSKGQTPPPGGSV